MDPVSRVIIRSARHEDVDVLARFSAAMASETEGRALDLGRLRDGTAAVLASPERGFYLVAEIPGDGSDTPEVVGQLLITFEWSDWRNATFWWIQSVYVAPGWRRRGIYRKMHNAVLSQARNQRDVCGVRLYVEKENTLAQMVYQKVGLLRTPYEVFEEDFILTRDTRPTSPLPGGRRQGKAK
jgi:ribosomal protein S18 acetylase RimI-like enzyme